MKRGQTRTGSLVEALTNIAVGFGINYTANLTILPLFGFKSETWLIALEIGMVFTVISLCRSYCLRRAYNWLGARGIFSHD